MLPYFEQPALHLGPLTIQTFGAIVALALWIAFTIAEKRFARFGLDREVGQKLGLWMVVGGAVGAHLFSQLLYFPERLSEDPWVLLRLWDNISSFGGILGGFGGALLYFAMRAPESVRPQRLAYLDAAAFTFPIGMGIGRLGCVFAHDHPGTVTSFPLAFSLRTDAAMDHIRGAYAAGGRLLPSNAATMGFHDLALYEFLYLAFLVVPLFVYWDRRERPTGFYLLAFALLYLPVRFGLDFLRVADMRYAWFTPAQWVALLLLAALPVFVARHRKARLTISGALILAASLACGSGVSAATISPPPAAGGAVENRAAIAADIVARTNEERARAGLRAFTTDAKLMEAARIHAEQMASARRAEHTIPGARYPTMESRLDVTGYVYASAAENVAWNQRSASAVVEGWMQSTGHRANILSTQLTQIGAAMARSANGEPYWVQVFGRPR